MRGSKREKRTGVWELRVFLGRDEYTGKILQKSQTFHGGKRAAEDKLRDLVEDAKRGRFGDGDATVGSALDAWLEHRKSLGRSPTTIVNYTSKIKTIKGSPLGRVRLSALSAEHVNGFYRERSETDSPTTVHHYHRIISGSLRFVEDQTWINWHGRSPADRAEPPQPDSPEEYSPPVEEVLRLIHEAEESREPEMATAMRLAALTGMRRGEVCGLRWSDIDWDRAIITIRRSIYQVPGEVGEKKTKNKRKREVNLGPAGLYLLHQRHDRAKREAKDAGADLSPTGYVLSKTEDGRVPWTPSRITQYTTRLRDRLGIHEFHFHSLRHWTSTELQAAGIDVRNIAGRVGHGDGGALILSRYSHRSGEQDRKAADVLIRLLGLPEDPDVAEA